MEWEVIKLKNLKNNNYTLLYSFYQLLLYPLVDKLINNEFLEYIKFMYTNYPAKYGEEISKKYKQENFCDAGEIYYELTK